jgi:hypothetical protein
MGDLIAFRANLRTYQRQRAYREAERLRLIMRIGIDPQDAPLFDEELKFMVYQASLKDKC